MQSENSKTIKNHIIRYVIYLVVVLGLTALAFYLTIGNKINSIIDVLKSANVGYVIAILAVVVGIIIARSIVIFVLTRIFEKKYMFHRAIAIDQIGSLYRMVTPAGVGSHVMETYAYSKQGVKVSNALSVLALYSIIYQIVLIIYGIITIILKRDLISQIGYIPISGNFAIPLVALIVIGFTFNVLTIGFILLISYWNPFYKFIRGPIYGLIGKMKLFKDVESKRNSLDIAVVNFRNNLKLLFKHIPTLIISLVMFFIYITISYSVPYICGLALGNTSIYANFWDSVLLSNFHQMVTCVVPLPGGSVVSELFFLRLFYPTSGPVFYSSEQIASASLLLWRGLMFIFPLIISLIFVLIYRPRKEVSNSDNHENQNPQE